MPRAIIACTYENCTAIFRHADRYERHLLKHSGERPFKCTYDECDKTYLCSSHLKRHEETHKQMFRCTMPGCSQILKTKATLRKHQDVFHQKKAAVKTYKCPECNEEFTKHCMLTRHSYTHTGIQTYKCSEPNCDKSFSMPSLLKRHMKRHVGYFCEEIDCGMYFPRWSLLCKHRKESHRKIFRCHICEKIFKHSSNLKAHSSMHKLENDVFPCYIDKCDRVYKLKHSLSDHVRTFHSTFTLACPEENCHRFLKTKDALEKHIQCRHRRRMSKKPSPKKPDFAEILSGFAKGSNKDLNPHLSSTFSEKNIEESNDEICIDSSERLSTSNTTEDELSINAQDSRWVSNSILEDRIKNCQSGIFEVKSLNTLDTTQNGKNLCLINEENSNAEHRVNVRITTELVSSVDLVDDEFQIIPCSEQDLKLSYSNIMSKDKELIETDADCHSLQDNTHKVIKITA